MRFFFTVILILFIGLRFFHLTDVMNFGSDQGRDFLAVWNIYSTKQITLIGPPSEYTVYGHQFFFGPAPYYLILPSLILGNWDPLFVSYFLILLNAGVLLFTLLILNKYIKNRTAILLFALFCTVTPIFVTYSQSYWNPYFMLPTSTLLLAS